MNNLIIFISKERILSSNDLIGDLPNQFLESQLYRMALFLIQNILEIIDKQTFISHSEEEKVNNALKVIFPNDWLKYAINSPNYHLNFKKYLSHLNDNSNKIIHSVIEFFCYEVIETSILTKTKNQNLFLLQPYDILKGLQNDAVLHNILREQKIYIIDNHFKIRANDISFPKINISKKGLQLIRIFIEILINNLIS
jgi:hypothetical protein